VPLRSSSHELKANRCCIFVGDDELGLYDWTRARQDDRGNPPNDLEADAGNLSISGGPFSGRGCSRDFLSSLFEQDVQQFAATAL
jgi:hypothetical protein